MNNVYLTHNDCVILLELINQELKTNSDNVRYTQLLFLKKKVEEVDKMVSK